MNKLLTQLTVDWSPDSSSLDPLSLADGGDYTCTASYTADGGTTVTRSDTEIVTPISKSYPVLTSLYSYL